MSGMSEYSSSHHGEPSLRSDLLKVIAILGNCLPVTEPLTAGAPTATSSPRVGPMGSHREQHFPACSPGDSTGRPNISQT